MEDMPKYPRLTRRSGVYYFRAKVPVDLQSHYGTKREITYSLKTKDLKEALVSVRVETVKVDQEFDAIRRRLNATPRDILSDAEISRLAAIYYHQRLEEDEEVRRDGFGLPLDMFRDAVEAVTKAGGTPEWSISEADNGGEGLSDRDYAQYGETLEYVGEALKVSSARGKTAIIQDEVEELLAAQGLTLPTGSPGHRKLSQAILQAAVRANEALQQRHAGAAVPTPAAPVPFVGSAPAVASQAKAGLTLTQIFEAWKADRAPPEKTALDFWAQIRRFAELHGDLPVEHVTRAHVREFKDAMVRFPARPDGQLRKLTVPQILERVGDDPAIPRLTAKTVNEKALAALKTVFNWAVGQGHVPASPAEGLVVASAAHHKKSRGFPYSTSELAAIFNSPVFTQDSRPAGGCGEAAKWLPLLGLFTGARLNELGQLRASDIRQTKGLHYIAITDDDGRFLKNHASKRDVPIHPELQRMGFLSFVDEARKVGNGQLFPFLKLTGRSVTDAWSKWWGRYARDYVPDRRKNFHSFRHTMKDAMRGARVHFEFQHILLGHSIEGQGAEYGEGHGIPNLTEELNKVQYPGLDFSHLYPAHREP